MKLVQKYRLFHQKQRFMLIKIKFSKFLHSLCIWERGENTYIGENSTPLKSSYRILYFEFSGINIDSEILDEDYHSNLNCKIGYSFDY